ncbi:MAG: M48 family metalloprotease [Gammaproteobacteria bacterium]|nr:M48 family metalloprotease [Gammaproteobacteria bacterium]
MRLLTSALVVITMLLSGCSSSVLPSRLNADKTLLSQTGEQYSSGLLGIGEEQDRYRNQSLGLGLISHPAAETYINEQLEKLKQASGISDLPGRAYLFADTALGARASADGNIYIPYAMLKDLETTDELAALLAHELAHTIRNHNSSDVFVKFQKKAVVAAALFANFKSNDTGVIRSEDERRIENAFTALMVSDGFINPGWTRRQEEEADKLGLDLMIAAGYNSEAMFTLLDKLTSWEEMNKQRQSSDNELVKNALASVNLNAESIPFGETVSGVLEKSAGKMDSLLSRFNKDHDSAEDRYNMLLDYADKHYPDVSSPVQERRHWQKISKSRQTDNIWRGLQHIVDARESMARGELASGELSIRGAVNVHTRHQNFVRQSYYELRSAQGKTSSMEQNLQLGLKGEYPSLMMHVEKTRLLTDKGDSNNQRQVLSLLDIFDGYGRPPSYYHKVIALAEGAGLSAKVTTLLADCFARYAGEGISCTDESKEKEENTDLSYGNFISGLFNKE